MWNNVQQNWLLPDSFQKDPDNSMPVIALRNKAFNILSSNIGGWPVISPHVPVFQELQLLIVSGVHLRLGET